MLIYTEEYASFLITLLYYIMFPSYRQPGFKRRFKFSQILQTVLYSYRNSSHNCSEVFFQTNLINSGFHLHKCFIPLNTH